MTGFSWLLGGLALQNIGRRKVHTALLMAAVAVSCAVVFAGGVLLRPFARLISGAGDSVTTYGDPWNMN